MRFIKNALTSPSARTLGIFAGGNLIVAVIGGLGGLLQARWIAPDVFGEFRKYGILTAYLNIGLILVHDGLSRQFPFLIGKRNKDEAIRVAASAKWWYLLMSWSFSLFFAALSLTSIINGDYRAFVGWLVQIPCIWAAVYGAYLAVMYRTSSDFKRLSYNNIIASVAGFAALGLVKAWGYWGLASRLAFQNIVGLYINRRHVPVKVKAALDIQRLVNLAKISLPLSIPGYIGTSWLTASISYFVLKYCGQSGLGIFGVASTFLAMSMTFTAALHQMFTTRLTHRFGEDENVFSCLKYAITPTLLSVGIATVLAVGMCLVIGPLIHILLPRYTDAIPVIRILSLFLPLSAAGLPLIVFQAALWYKTMIALALIRVIVCLAAIAIFPKTLSAIAACLILGAASSLVAGYCILEWNRLKT